jgi:MFS family permease
LFALIAAPQISYFGDKLSLVIGPMTYAIYIGVQLLAVIKHARGDSFMTGLDWLIEALLYVTSVINGWGCSIFWVVAMKYVNECANEKNQGLFNSIYWTLL